MRLLHTVKELDTESKKKGVVLFHKMRMVFATQSAVVYTHANLTSAAA